MTGLIKEIKIDKPDTYENKIFITMDLDWCPDFVLEYVLEILEKYNLKCTFFITHETKLLKYLRENTNKYELGIHPNFNYLLKGNFRYDKFL